MASAEKHKKRSQRSSHTGIPQHMFLNHAVNAKINSERRNLFKQLFHKTQDK